MEKFIKIITNEKIENNKLIFLRKLIEKYVGITFVSNKEENNSFTYTFNLESSVSENQMKHIVETWFEKYPDPVFFENSTPLEDLSDENMKIMLDELSRFMHNDNVRKKIENGWRYGEHFSITEKTSPLLVPYEQLPEEYKELRPDIFMKVLSIIGKNL